MFLEMYATKINSYIHSSKLSLQGFNRRIIMKPVLTSLNLFVTMESSDLLQTACSYSF